MNILFILEEDRLFEWLRGVRRDLLGEQEKQAA